MRPHRQAYAAGWLEGALPGYALRMYQTKLNVYNGTFTNGTIPQQAATWVDNQNNWIQQQISANPQDNYWQQVKYIYIQMEGLLAGYLTAADPVTQPMSLQDVQFINLQAEVGDILLAIDPIYRAQQDVLNMHDFERVKATMMKNSHCSALIRISPDGSDLFAAHTTWTSYSQMLRVFKYYNIPLSVGANAVQFSSYFGTLHSIDDYYVLSNRMIVIETTNNVANMSLYSYVVPTSLPTFVRIILANRITDSGEEWANTYAMHNSGTYNNQSVITSHMQIVENCLIVPPPPVLTNNTRFVKLFSFWFFFFFFPPQMDDCGQQAVHPPRRPRAQHAVGRFADPRSRRIRGCYQRADRTRILGFVQ
jgi:hypothetical protein